MPERVRVILMFDDRLPEAVRVELGSMLEDAGWASASDNETCYVCRARADDLEKIERRIRKSIEFAAFTAEQIGRFPFVIQVGEGEPKAMSVCVGGAKTEQVKRSGGLDFATERIPRSHPLLPKELRSPNCTQLKTAF